MSLRAPSSDGTGESPQPSKAHAPTKKLRTFLFGLLVVGVGTLAISGGPLVDLKPDVLTEGPQLERERKGRRLLHSAYEAVGGERSMARRAFRFRLRDQWQGVASYLRAWPERDQEAHVVLESHTFNSRVLFLNGDAAGTTWGITEGEGWVEENGRRRRSDDRKLLFVLPTVHYFVEMSQRLTEAEVVRWIGERSIGSDRYDVVFASWGTVEANAQFDQYLVFINQASGRIEKSHFTVRESARFASGASHFDDFRDVGGVAIPHRITITRRPEDPVDDYFHRMTLQDAEWLDAFEQRTGAN